MKQRTESANLQFKEKLKHKTQNAKVIVPKVQE